MMREFAYYPGCSMEHSALPYEKSIQAVFKALGVGLREIEDWNCCGATMYMSIDKTASLAVSARNLALAQEMKLNVCAPCSSCYTVLCKTNLQLKTDAAERQRVSEALDAAHLKYDGGVAVRHPLDILVNDVGLDEIARKVVHPLRGLRVAPYYGCQIVRPYGVFDSVDDPLSMDRLLTALGAQPVPYPPKVRCCGGMLMTTAEDVALELNMKLLDAAVESGAEIVATACPLCQMNLETYQREINKAFGRVFRMPVVYFTHLIGIALGISAQELGLDQLVVPAEALMQRSTGAVK